MTGYFAVATLPAVTSEEWQIVRFSLTAAAVAALAIVPPGLAVAWLLARRRFPGKALVETVISLPLVMPPVATGFLLLELFGRRDPLGALLHRLDLDVIFTARGVMLVLEEGRLVDRAIREALSLPEAAP